MNRIIILAAFAGIIPSQGHACNHANPNPLDTSCHQSDFRAPTNTVSWFASNPYARISVLLQCRNPSAIVRPPATDCANAAAAEHGSVAIGGH